MKVKLRRVSSVSSCKQCVAAIFAGDVVMWTPNHFVPLLAIKNSATIDLRSSTKQTYEAATNQNADTTSTPEKQVSEFLFSSFLLVCFQ